MPPADVILNGLTAIANNWRPAAIGWHVALGVLIAALSAGWKPSKGLLATLLVLPLVSVSALAWATGNPFNGLAFAAVSVALAVQAGRMGRESVTLGPPLPIAAGAALVIFGWAYPHFVYVETPLEYLYAAPLGLVPCPTLSMVLGATLIADRFGSRGWGITLVAAGLFYGVVGVVRLGVTIDAVMLTGALGLGATLIRDRAENATRRLSSSRT